MSRPIYETNRNESHEALIARTISSLWDSRLFKTPKLYPYDYCAMARDGSGRVVGILEIKRRHIELRPDGFVPFVSLHKAAEMLRYSNEFGLRPLLVFGFDNCIAYTDLSTLKSNPNKHWVAKAGRTSQTRSEGDVEPMLFIHYDQWTVVTHTEQGFYDGKPTTSGNGRVLTSS